MYTEVDNLLIGIKDENGVTHTEFEYREMTGHDEEALAKPKVKDNGSVALRTVLERCIIRIGGITKDSVKPNKWKEIIQGMYINDQDYAFMKIRALSIGDTLTVTNKCPNPSCKKKIKTEFEIDEFEIIPYDGIEDIEFELPKGYYDKEGNKHTTGTIRRPVGLDREILDISARNNFGLANTLLLARCIKTLGDVKIHDSVIKDLSMKDRDYLLKLLAEHRCGYDIGEFDIECPECGEQFTATLNNADFL